VPVIVEAVLITPTVVLEVVVRVSASVPFVSVNELP
jgi:hypothetical protein